VKALDRRSIGTYLFAAFGTLCAILVTIGALFWIGMRSIERTNELESRALAILASVDETVRGIERVQADVLRQLLASDGADIGRIDRAIRVLEAANTRHLDAYQRLVESTGERRFLARVLVARTSYWAQTQPVLTLGRANRDAEATELVIGRQAPAYDEYLKSINELAEGVEAEAAEATRDLTRFIGRIRILGDLLLGATMLIAVGTAFGVAGVTRQLNEDNRVLQVEVGERKRAEDTLRESEEKFRQLADNISDVFWIASPDLQTMHYVSIGYQRVLGRSLDSLYANPQQWADAIVPEDRPSVVALFAALAVNPKEVSVEYRIARPDGTIRWVHARGFQVQNAAGHVVRLAGIVSDVTDRKRGAEELRESERRFSDMLRNLELVAMMLDRNGQLTYCNDYLLRLTGWTRDEVIGGNWVELFVPPEIRVALRGAYGELLANTPVTWHYENEILTRAGGRRLIRWNNSVLRAAGGDVIGTASIGEDITDRKAAEAALRGSEARTRAIVDSSLDCIVTIDQTGAILEFNPAAEHVFGYPRAAVLGRELAAIIVPPSVRDAHRRGLARYLATGEISILGKRIEIVAMRCDGSEFPVELSITRFDSDGPPTFAGFIRDISERKRAEEVLQRLRDQHALILNSIGEGVHGLGLDGNIMFENPASAAMLGYDVAELIGKPAHVTIHHSRADGTPYPQAECQIHATLHDGLVRHVSDEVFCRRNGTTFPVQYTSAPLRDESHRIIGATVVFADITDRKRLEGQLLQSQKMETVGKLAGGVAHEFNSILTAIVGQSALLRAGLPATSPLARNATEISKAAERAAILTRQLLAYGRKQVLRPEVLDLRAVVAGMEGTLRHVMGRGVDVRIVAAAGLHTVKADAGQLEQLVMNMAMNAADAMPNGGALTLAIENVTLDQSEVGRLAELKPGDYVLLAITDTGAGMNEEVQARIFEPFFSTKAVGEGTGLGLATCYGIVKQSGGHLTVSSERGRGATFKVYLPMVERPAPAAAAAVRTSPDLPRGTETVLLVEDDPALREMASTLLRRLGYTVLAAADGIEALRLTDQRGAGDIDLLFTDAVMPHMSGEELAERVHGSHPDTRILFTSASTASAIDHQGLLNGGAALLTKPFTPSALAHTLRRVLDHATGED
jgi:two-component system cell cycle sensor histidine kinase/response regulator CckA